MVFNRLIKIAIFLTTTLLISCKETGVQGGKVDISFTGIEKISILSPTSVKVTWTKDSKYLNYKIYMKGSSTPIDSSSFSEYIVTGLTPNTGYEFSVSGFSEGTASEDHQQSFKPTSTYSAFTGLDDGDLEVTSATRLDLNWESAGANVTYEISYKKRTEADWGLYGSVPATSGASVVASVTGLLGGTEYCVRVKAVYIDSSELPADLDQPEYCVTTFTDLTNLPTVYVGSASPGNYPWFNAVGGNPAYRIEIFNELDKDTPIASTNSGDGAFRASTFIPPSKVDVFAIVKDVASGVQARVEVTYSDPSSLDLSVRNFYDHATKGAIYPPLMNDGKGVQNLGQQIVSGDFNCDGLKDVAVSAPYASPVENEDLIYETGAVVIYYSYDPPFNNETATDPLPYLNTEGVPLKDSVFPAPHLIHYPLQTSARLGTKLQVGNFNGDCFYRDIANPVGDSCSNLFETHKSSAANILKINKCDDLVIAGRSPQKNVFVVYGDPLQGLVSGSGGTNYGVDEYTCDASSSSCRSVKLNDPSSDIRTLGDAIGTGDFNNDGFDDILLTATHTVSSVNEKIVHVLRGTDQGVTPIGNSKSFKSIATNDSGIFPSAPPSYSDGFGFSLSGFYNSRECISGGSYNYRENGPTQGYGYDFTKCDDVVIGAPLRSSSRGSIYTCKAVLPLKDPLIDDEKIIDWDCAEHYPSEIENEADKAEYGYSLVSIKNQNGYPLDDNKIIDSGFPDVTGALFVGARKRTVNSITKAGAVYGYYVTPNGDDHGTGGIQGVLSLTPGHAITARNSIPCDVKNNTCENQLLTNSPAQAGAYFGNTLSHIESIVGGNILPHLAVSAPYRNVANEDGTISDAGTVYLYSPDISTFGIDNGAQVSDTQRNLGEGGSCTINCTWYSGGLSPFGPILMFPQDLNINANFGMGGAVGGDFNADGFGDLYASAQNYSTPIDSNGAVFGFHSNDGSFSAVENEVDSFINTNISKELNYRFENAKVIGDINGDGYDDVVTKIEVGVKIDLVVYYGSASGLIKSSDPSVNAIGLNPKILFNSSDPLMGLNFYKVGSINCDAFDDILLLGHNGAYVYYGSSTGVISSAQPSPTPVGKNPLYFGRQSATADQISINTYTVLSGQEESGYDSSNQSVGYGDYNADNCTDIAIGVNRQVNFDNVTDTTDKLELNIGTNDYSVNNQGRVVVIYGSNNGLQIGDPNGYLLLSKPGGLKGNVVSNNPCVSGDCKVQLISSPGPTLSSSFNGAQFGFDVIGIPSITEADGELTSELLISDPNENSLDGAVYLYLGSSSGIQNEYHQSLVPNLNTYSGDLTDFSNEEFGSYLASAGDINNDNYPDVVVSAPGSANVKGHIYIFYGGKIGGEAAFVGESNLGDRDFWGASSSHLNVNDKFTTVGSVKPQVLDAINIDDRDLFGNGVSSLGDFNSDGYADIIVNVALGDYLQEVSLENSGMGIIYFGSELGLQIDKEESTAPKCIYSNTPQECAPFQVHLPSRQIKERSYLSNSCFGDINGDGSSDLLMGARGRHHPSGKATATGVFYIMY